jgi:hypothetical protein
MQAGLVDNKQQTQSYRVCLELLSFTRQAEPYVNSYICQLFGQQVSTSTLSITPELSVYPTAIMGQSMHGWKADDFFVAVKQHLDAMEPNRPTWTLHQVTEAAVAVRNVAVAIKQSLDIADAERYNQVIQNFRHAVEAMIQLLLRVNASLNSVLQTIQFFALLTLPAIFFAAAAGVYTYRGLKKCAENFFDDMRIISDRSELQKNLHQQQHFAAVVYNFYRYCHDLHEGEMPRATTGIPESLDHRFFIYRPSSDWHPKFVAIATKNWRPNVNHSFWHSMLFNNLQALITAVDKCRNEVDSEVLIYILLPSAHAYQLPIALDFAKSAVPIKIIGQTQHDGKPYCRGRITGVHSVKILDVEASDPLPLDNFQPVKKMMGVLSMLGRACAYKH